MLRNSGTVRPIFSKIVSKVAQDLKEKSHESAARKQIFPQNCRAKCRGGGGFRPPPVLLGLKENETLICSVIVLIKS